MIDLSQYSGKSIAVFGLGKSGISAARALQNSGAEVSAWDDDPLRRSMAQDLGVTLSDLYRTEWDAFVGLVLSPGVPLTHPAPHPLVARALITRIEILGDMELFARSRPPGRVVGVTGTNGKSTTSALITHLLQVAGREVQLGGNIGVPVLDLEAGSDDGIYVLELSSFQLDLIRSLISDVAVLLNIAPDHIERHGDFPNYIASKTRIFTRRASSQTAVIGVDDDICRRIRSELAGRRGRSVVAVSAKRVARRGIYIQEGVLIDDLDGRAEEIADLAGLTSLRGVHNLQNAAAAYAVIRTLGVEPREVADAFATFKGLPHRQEVVAQLDRVTFVNDSKATNAESTARGLACFDNIYWIAGGRAKDGGIASLSAHFPRMVHVFLIGEAAGALAQTLEGQLPFTKCDTLEDAVAEATAQAVNDRRSGAVVLLSPACASFDQFSSFEERGNRFRELVLAEISRRDGAPTATRTPVRNRHSTSGKDDR